MDLNCSECYESEFVACYSHLFLDVSLNPSTTYYIWLKDKFNNFYITPVESDTNGDLHVPIADFPEGMLIENTGTFTLYISTSTAVNTKEEFTISDTDYDCIVFSLTKQTIL
jgi:hypothetical protein